MRYTISVDFDGVIHSYTTPWVKPHIIPDPPVEGAITWLSQMVQHFNVVIFSTRCRTWRGRRAMRRWLREHSGFMWDNSKCQHVEVSGGEMRWRPASGHGLEEVRFSYTKVPALIYLDDRAVRFDGPGTFPTRNAIHQQYVPWNKDKHSTRTTSLGPIL